MAPNSISSQLYKTIYPLKARISEENIALLGLWRSSSSAMALSPLRLLLRSREWFDFIREKQSDAEYMRLVRISIDLVYQKHLPEQLPMLLRARALPERERSSPPSPAPSPVMEHCSTVARNAWAPKRGPVLDDYFEIAKTLARFYRDDARLFSEADIIGLNNVIYCAATIWTSTTEPHLRASQIECVHACTLYTTHMRHSRTPDILMGSMMVWCSDLSLLRFSSRLFTHFTTPKYRGLWRKCLTQLVESWCLCDSRSRVELTNGLGAILDEHMYRTDRLAMRQLHVDLDEWMLQLCELCLRYETFGGGQSQGTEGAGAPELPEPTFHPIAVIMQYLQKRGRPLRLSELRAEFVRLHFARLLSRLASMDSRYQLYATCLGRLLK